MKIAAEQEDSIGSTKESLLLAAEKLFGMYGMEGTSLRRIGIEAGQSNTSAVQYYFEDRQDLAYQILNWRVGLMEAERGNRLRQALESGGQEPKLRALVEALFLPVLTFTDQNGRHPFARFLAEYMTTFRQHGVLHPEDLGSAPNLVAIVLAIETELVHLPPALVRLRTTTTMVGFLSLLCQKDENVQFKAWSPPLETLLEEGLRMAVASLSTAPSRAALKSAAQKPAKPK